MSGSAGVSRDSQAKVDRANEHIAGLEHLIDTFAGQAYSIDMYPDFWEEPAPPAKGDVVIVAEAAVPPPAIEWGPIIGDAIHGFRSALDQLAWGLSIDFQTSPPPPDPIPMGNRWRDIAFPICVKKSQWTTAKRKKLWAIDPTLRASLKALQPFVTGQQAPDREPLAVLEELWNIDKHRHLHLVNATVELHDVLSIEPFPGAPDVEFEVVSKRPPGPLVGRTKVGGARLIQRPGGVIAMTLPQMHMNPRLAVDVAFDQGAPAHGGRVLETLRQIGETVQAVISAF